MENIIQHKQRQAASVQHYVSGNITLCKVNVNTWKAYSRTSSDTIKMCKACLKAYNQKGK
jgi:hypothetical protein